MLSVVMAGFPSPASDYTEKLLDFNELLIHRVAATYCLRVSGLSMSGAGIFPNDILVVDRSLNPVNGDIVVVSINGEFVVKRYIKQGSRFYLRSENPEFPNFYPAEGEEFFFFGVASSVVRQFRKG